MWKMIQTVLLCCVFASIAGSNASLSAAKDLTDVDKKGIVYKMYADYKKKFPAVVDVTPQEAMRLLQENQVLFVDIREPAEMQVSMLPGAISKEQLLSESTRYSGYTIVGYCTISYRSGMFAQKMASKGLRIYNLKGGLLAWTLEGGKVYDANGDVTKRIHVYGKKWNFAPNGYEAVRFRILQ